MPTHARAAEQFTRLVEIVARLRAPDGCPWDREQTIDSLKPFVLEETYEVLQAIDQHDHPALCEELGDFLFEAVFLAQMEEEAGHFSIADALQSIADKLVRRHPHVFARDAGEAGPDNAGEVRTRWEAIKAAETPKGGHARKTLLGGLSPTLPALLRAYQIGLRAQSVGFDWQRVTDVVAKIEEEVAEIREVVEAGPLDHARAEEEMGDLLFTIANLSRHLGVEPETALRKANDKFTARYGTLEATVLASGRQVPEVSAEELEAIWQRVKRELKERSAASPADR